jgi:hypothetical protein
MRAAALCALAGGLLATSASAQYDPRTPSVLAAVGAQLGGVIEPDARYAIVFGDLNDDHQPEAMVHLVDRAHCGSGGCTTFVLTYAADGWHSIGKMTASRLPIYRLPDHHNGWFDLAVYVGGGGVPPGLRAVRFAKGRYASNPTKAPSVGRLPQLASPLLPVTSEFMGVGGN